VALVGGRLGEAVGKLYVEAYFPAESKAKMEALVGNLKVAMRARIEKLGEPRNQGAGPPENGQLHGQDRLSRHMARLLETDHQVR
jgi:hypothetical protein